ncbi:FAD-dependent oxidoreductase [Variovorax ureilyticus]|uniref:FAD-dependent oxidoreductase n=1 Tax=Variovorax ureilyticus TaxID=1836198 RepID=A0ABU8VAG3_9BURK
MDTMAMGVAAGVRPDATIVIVGAGQAGGWAAQTLRTEGFGGRIVLLGDEAHVPHERPPLSKALLAGEAAAESTWLFKEAAFAALDLDWRPATRVARIDRAGKRIELADGEPLAYDKLILCSGGRARPLAVPGADTARIHTLRTIGDAERLGSALGSARSLVVIGGGWIGLEVAATARKKGLDVVVLESQFRLCERSVPAQVSAHLLALHRAHGTRVVLDAKVKALGIDDDGRSTVELGDGETLRADALFAGVGLIPNDELAREAGLECDGGVLVDTRCVSSDPDILAAGDVAVTPNRWAGRRLRLESWQNAQEQGMAAARSALGQDVDHQPLPWFWSDQYDMNLQIYGMPAATDRVVMRGQADAGSFLLFYLDGEVVKAAIGINAARDLRFARRLIEQRKAVDAARLADHDVAMARI